MGGHLNGILPLLKEENMEDNVITGETVIQIVIKVSVLQNKVIAVMMTNTVIHLHNYVLGQT